MSGVANLELRLLRACAQRDRYAREFIAARPLIDRLVKARQLERIKPAGSRHANMIRITAAGRRRVQA